MSVNVTRGGIVLAGGMKAVDELAFGDSDEIRIPKEACSNPHAL